MAVDDHIDSVAKDKIMGKDKGLTGKDSIFFVRPEQSAPLQIYFIEQRLPVIR